MYCLDMQRLVGKIIYDFGLIKTLLQEIRFLFYAQSDLARTFMLTYRGGQSLARYVLSFGMLCKCC